MCQRLGISLTTSSIPQVKGRIERLFQTLQSRLVVELSLNNIINTSFIVTIILFLSKLSLIDG